MTSIISGAVAAAKGIAGPATPINATFRPLRGAPSLPRSSHSLTCVGNRAYIFGGEVEPRKPVDNAIHVLALPSAELQDTDYVEVPAKPEVEGGDVPAPRVGHAAAAVGSCIYIFGGRGGTDMQALEEHGRVWVFDTKTTRWSHLDPIEHTSHPEARSYHTMTSSDHPLPPNKPNVANVIMNEPPDGPGKNIPEPLPKNSMGTLFVHAGCLSSGGRAGDLWAFDIASHSWSKMLDAPGPARGGTSLSLVKNRLYRFGGFDGEKELGGAVDWLDLVSSTYDDESGRGEMPLHPSNDGWHSDNFSVGSENKGGPTNRSVAGMVPVSTGQGRNYLLIFGGETTPSNQGHAGAGKFLNDAWAFQLKPEGGTAAAIKDATRGVLMGKTTGEAEISEVRYVDADGKTVQDNQLKPMSARGWFAADAAGDIGGGNTIVVWGGVNEQNERLGNGWTITVA